MTLDILYELDITCDYDCSDSQEDDNLSTLKKLLLDAKEMQELQQAGLSNKYVTKEFKEDVDHAVNNDCNKIVSFRLR